MKPSSSQGTVTPPMKAQPTYLPYATAGGVSLDRSALSRQTSPSHRGLAEVGAGGGYGHFLARYFAYVGDENAVGVLGGRMPFAKGFASRMPIFWGARRGCGQRGCRAGYGRGAARLRRARRCG